MTTVAEVVQRLGSHARGIKRRVQRTLAGRRAPAVAARRPNAEDVGAAGADILLVEDDAQLASSLSMLLTDHRLTLVTSGREAVARCAERAYDVILCDLFVADLSGIEAYEQIRRLRPGLEQRMVFMTGGAFTASAQRFLDQVPNPVLYKPFAPQELLTLVEASARGWSPTPD